MDLTQGKLIDGDNEILTMDTKLLLKQLNINSLTNPCKHLTLFYIYLHILTCKVFDFVVYKHFTLWYRIHDDGDYKQEYFGFLK